MVRLPNLLSRRGTAMRLDRIMPVAYSPVTTRTPRTPIASCASSTPPRLRETGSKPARSRGFMWSQWVFVT